MRRDETIKALCEKSERSLAAAEVLIEHGDFDFAVSRTYYAMFYMAEALLFLRGLSFSSHSAVIAALHKEFVSTGKLPQRMHSALHIAFGLRQKGDYLSDAVVTEDTAQSILESAREFVSFAKDLLD